MMEFLRKAILGAAGFCAGLALLTLPMSTAAISVSSQRDCDSNAVIRCGALSTSELIKKYNSNSSTRAIFLHFGISPNDIGNIGSTAAAGRVTKSGKVVVNGKTVATNALTAGRQNISGSRKVTSRGVTFYERAPSVSFASSSLSAFVVMNNGRFEFAILASCGNPVRATAVKKPQKKVVVAPSIPAPTPPVVQQQQQQQQSITVVAPPKQPAKAPAPTPKPAPTSIINTGPGDIVGASSLVAVMAGFSHAIYRRWRWLTY